MSEYAIGVFVICLVGGVCLTLVHGSGRAEGIALGVIILWVILSPIGESLSHFDPDSLSDLVIGGEYEGDENIDLVIEEAFADGIVGAVAEKFSIDKEDIRVRLYGFDRDSLTAEKIRIILSGRAALADYKAVEKYIDEMNIGECEVEIEIGKRLS